MNENSSKEKSHWLDKLSKGAGIVGIVAPIILTCWVNYTNQNVERQIKELDTSQKRLKINQDSLGFDREFKFKIYALAIDAIKSKDSVQQKAAYIAVKEMMPDMAFRAELLKLFADSKTVVADIRKEATVATFDITESKKKNPVYSPKDKIHVDIIYLEGSSHAKSVARKIYNALRSSDNYESDIKPFPVEHNERPVYQITKNTIRYDPDEKAKSEKLMEVVNQILPEGTEPFTIAPTTAGKPTVQYISLFVVK